MTLLIKKHNDKIRCPYYIFFQYKRTNRHFDFNRIASSQVQSEGLLLPTQKDVKTFLELFESMTTPDEKEKRRCQIQRMKIMY
ncbi:hypothetical protein RH08_00370 [Candidatus Liberibacter asiaticus]|nr:hypothetical protein B2I23_00345 [Candidatus Liberibacter asiaticus]AWL13636.1 hypothetical protein DIC79_00360 [Candidatus Liberibacter asiaticus]KIH95416.1 hypothetical protein RH08_00370 [Candidatus Liberibacter asiaticus]KPG63421.1 hypothetical protein AL011_00310 [Candidatus Liberibacter asiaticus]KRF68566.1 hypothetical protein AQ620_04070 [Candidatus Liberibacter asiaticus]